MSCSYSSVSKKHQSGNSLSQECLSAADKTASMDVHNALLTPPSRTFTEEVLGFQEAALQWLKQKEHSQGSRRRGEKGAAAFRNSTNNTPFRNKVHLFRICPLKYYFYFLSLLHLQNYGFIHVSVTMDSSCIFFKKITLWVAIQLSCLPNHLRKSPIKPILFPRIYS